VRGGWIREDLSVKGNSVSKERRRNKEGGVEEERRARRDW